MNKVQYIFYCLRHMDYKTMYSVLKEVSKKAHRPRLFTFCDMVNCGLRYQAGYIDYQLFEFYCLNHAQRETILTRGKNNAIIRRYNDKSLFPLFEDKGKFCALYQEFLHRDYLDLRCSTPQDLAAFLQKHREIIVKPVDGIGGHGIEKLTTDEGTDPAELYDRLLANGQNLVEEVIIQHPELSRLYPGSVNTLRLFTFFDGTEAHLVQAVLKLGNHGKVIDNFSGGGMYTFLDENGVVKYPAVDGEDKVYEAHPMTGVPLVGFQVPCFQEARALVQEAAKVTPAVGYVGWDVAIAETGPAIVEGNGYPGNFEPRGSFLKGEYGSLAVYRKYMDI